MNYKIAIDPDSISDPMPIYKMEIGTLARVTSPPRYLGAIALRIVGGHVFLNDPNAVWYENDDDSILGVPLPSGSRVIMTVEP